MRHLKDIFFKKNIKNKNANILTAIFQFVIINYHFNKQMID